MEFTLNELKQSLYNYGNLKLDLNSIEPVQGGDICRSFKIQSGSNIYFLKTHNSCKYEMLRSEANNLDAISQTQTIKTPKIIHHGKLPNCSYLLLEYLELQHTGSHVILGKQLAKLHLQSADEFGWNKDNWIGSTPQLNKRCEDWIQFWRDNRLRYQLKLAEQNNAPTALLNVAEKLLDSLPALFESYKPKPSLLHGDLWSGNFAFADKNTPVIYDPACYYGDHEADIAMTELFGGFKHDFYSAYHEIFPVDKGYVTRKDLYNLYHILNHFNLFGGSYALQADQLCQKLLSAIK